MKTRVCNTRLNVSAALLVLAVVAAAFAAPVFARENIAVGQAGDPGDGEEVFSGGSSNDGSTTVTRAESVSNPEKTRAIPVLIPVFVSGVVFFQVYLVAANMELRRQ
ncbi:MAG: hypothetical protein IPG61_02155 [bacterium]|nr:hypothetical protein [bacterium]